MFEVLKKKESECYVIAEAGLNHNGSIKIAKELINAAFNAKANAVKFQKRTIDKLATKTTLNAVDSRFPVFGKTYKEIRQHLEFDLEQYKELKSYTESKGMDFIVTAFDIDAVDFLDELQVDVIKIASHSLTNTDLLEYLATNKKKTIMSTGMAQLEEVDTAVEIFKRHKSPLLLMHCVSAYPTPEKECNLSMISKLTERYSIPVGYSGHEIGWLPSKIAVGIGAKAIERHFTLNKKMVGFDHKISLEPDELTKMIEEIRLIESILGSGEKKVSKTEQITRDKYHVSMVSKRKINKGEPLTKSLITYKNPGTGIPKKNEGLIIGKLAKDHIEADILLDEEMFI